MVLDESTRVLPSFCDGRNLGVVLRFITAIVCTYTSSTGRCQMRIYVRMFSTYVFVTIRNMLFALTELLDSCLFNICVALCC